MKEKGRRKRMERVKSTKKGKITGREKEDINIMPGKGERN